MVQKDRSRRELFESVLNVSGDLLGVEIEPKQCPGQKKKIFERATKLQGQRVFQQSFFLHRNANFTGPVIVLVESHHAEIHPKSIEEIQEMRNKKK